MLLQAFFIVLEGFVHLADTENQLRSEDFLVDEVAEFECQVHLVEVDES